jgi:hypothetical protein
MKRPFSIVRASAVLRAFGAVAVLSNAGCDDPLTRVDLVANVRVLGGRVEVEGEPERASPAPGETASVRWLVAAPELFPALGWAFSVCPAAPPGGSLPSCAAEPFAMSMSEKPVPGEPRIDFTVPDDLDARALAVFGVVCPGSGPTFSPGGFDCAGPGGRLVSLDFELQTAEASNLNPVLEPDALTLDGDSLPEGMDCATLPSVARGSSHTLELWLDESDRDSVESETSADPSKEELQVSSFTTAGSLERVFTVFEADDSELVASVRWKAPEAVPLDGFVRLFFVVRDLRGGSDWIERFVCVE